MLDCRSMNLELLPAWWYAPHIPLTTHAAGAGVVQWVVKVVPVKLGNVTN